MPLPPLIRTSTARKFLKELSDGFRIGEDAAERLITLVTDQVKAIGLVALQRAQKEDRTTMLDDDIQAAFDAHFDTTVVEMLDPAAIRQAITNVSTPDLEKLITLLIKDLNPDAQDEEDDQG